MVDGGPEGSTVERGRADDDFPREVNENILEIGERFGLYEELLELVCECGDACCHEHVAVPTVDYERLVQQGHCLVVAPGHEHTPVLVRGKGYVVCDA